MQLLTVYYNVAQQSENFNALKETLKISKDRLTRSEYQFDYGQNTKLDVLNAEVDVNNDSIRFLNEKRLLANSKRNLNLLLGRNVTVNFVVDTEVEFNLIFEFDQLLEKSKQYNVEIQKINKNILIKEQQKVKSGQHIADMGSNGANKTILHFEIRKNGKTVNPIRYLTR